MKTEPLIFFNSRQEITKREITFPSGKKIVISAKHPEYQTDDPEEIEFLSDVFAIGCRKLNEQEYTGYLSARFEDMPHIHKRPVQENIDKYTAITESEKHLVELLKEKGYTVYKRTERVRKTASKGTPKAKK